ncbi:MAG: type II toxin-antitoxin system VapC family toxin [Leptospira sp.]|nr:type II toxin-antitoxin system VapC family toxin [Leptospira sp.]
MITFVDTSSLVKKYIDEIGSDRVTNLIIESDAIILSPITSIEFYSAMQRLINTMLLTKEDYEIANEEYQIDMNDFDYIEFNPPLELLAIEMLKKYGIRSLDGIQLASAKMAKLDRFITSDRKLYEASIKELISVESIFI